MIDTCHCWWCGELTCHVTSSAETACHVTCKPQAFSDVIHHVTLHTVHVTIQRWFLTWRVISLRRVRETPTCHVIRQRPMNFQPVACQRWFQKTIFIMYIHSVPRLSLGGYRRKFWWTNPIIGIHCLIQDNFLGYIPRLSLVTTTHR